MSDTFKSFADDIRSIEVSGLTVENGTREIALYGQTALTRDAAGLKKARALRALLEDIVTALEAQPLPDRVEPAPAPEVVDNPFREGSGS